MMTKETETGGPKEADPNTASEFVRPAWAVMRPSSLSDSTPRVTTDELRRPAFTPSDSMPRISTGDLPRPNYARLFAQVEPRL